MVFLCFSVADRLHPSGRNLVDLGWKENLLRDLVILSYWRQTTVTGRLPLCGVKERTGATEGLNWQEGADDGKMMNKYPAEQYCGCLLTAASKPVVLHFFESIHFNIKISLWAIQHFLAVQLCSSRFMSVGVDGDILYICHSWDKCPLVSSQANLCCASLGRNAGMQPKHSSRVS